MKTPEQIQKLKTGWTMDPCWDIEHTEGFEEHEDELREYRRKMEARWAAEAKARKEADPAYQARKSLARAAEDRDRDWASSMEFQLKMAQVQATLALVDRLDKVTDDRGRLRITGGEINPYP